MCCSFQKASSDLREALAGTARWICSSYVDPDPLKPCWRNASNLVDFCSWQASVVNQTVSSVSGQSWELGTYTLATKMRTSWSYLIKEHDLTFKLGQPVSPAVHQLNPQSNMVHPAVEQVDPSNQPSPNSWKARPVLNQAGPYLNQVILEFWTSSTELYIRSNQCNQFYSGSTQFKTMSQL